MPLRPCVPRPPVALMALCVVLACAAPARGGKPDRADSLPGPRARNVVFLIGDGFGPAYVALARGVADRPLAFDPHLVGSATTSSHSSRVTDSGAAATALASGIHTDNNAIGVDPSGRARTTVLEAAEARGLATGLVVTSRLTHATPAAFAAHVSQRSEEEAIARQMSAAGIEVLLGGGAREFRRNGPDARDLAGEAAARGVRVVTDRAELACAPPGPLLGLFAPSHMPFALDRDTLREPALAEMTRAALARLSRDPDGFFLMVEGSRIDHAGHVNDAASAAREVLEFERAFEAALEFARRDRHTLVVATADHETGGLSLGREVDGRSYYEWSPELLRAARASADSMAVRVSGGEDPRAVLAELAGVRDLSEAESAAIRELRGDARKARLAHAVSERARIGWTTLGHTAVDVPVWAFGPGADALRGTWSNADLGRRIAALLGLRIGEVRPGVARAPAGGSPDD